MTGLRFFFLPFFVWSLNETVTHCHEGLILFFPFSLPVLGWDSWPLNETVTHCHDGLLLPLPPRDNAAHELAEAKRAFAQV